MITPPLPQLCTQNNMLGLRQILRRWRAPNGYADVLRVGTPLVISMGAATLMLFTDRVFLGRYSLDAIAAAGPAGAFAFVFLALLAGAAGYVNTFIAQYYGAGRYRQIGRALWQAIYLTLFAGILLAVIGTTARPLFKLFEHPAEIQAMERTYFQILLWGGLPHVLRDVLATFFSGRGKTRPIMLVSMSAAAMNIPLDYAMINGYGIIPELGIAGAAWATVISHAFGALLFAILIFRPRHEQAYGVIREWRLDRALCARLIRFGLPSGLQLAMDVIAFSFYLMIIGRIGRIELAVSNIAFSINSLVFMPMIGLSIATAIMVGQAIGRDQPSDGVQATRSALHLTTAYMTALALLLILMPTPILRLFSAPGTPAAEAAAILSAGKILLRFVAAYSLLDVMNVIYSGALRGAGDIRFVTWTIAILSFSGLVLPTLVAVERLHLGLYAVWTIGSIYICILALIFRWRFKQGRWQSMRVIEPSAPRHGSLAPSSLP